MHIELVEKQIKDYFHVLHDADQKGGLFVFAPQNNLGYIYSRDFFGCISELTNKMNKYKNNSMFISMNSYKKISEDNIRSENNLWGLDAIMIDIDAPVELVGKEQEVIDVLSWYWDKKGLLPKPNLYSFTGGGGIHLYYSFKRLPAQAKGSVRKVKELLNSAITYIIETDTYFINIKECGQYGSGYKVDNKVVDNQRFDRLPGSINPKTKRRCVCFITDRNLPRYDIRDLINFIKSSDLHINDASDYKIVKFDKNIKNSNKLLYRLNNKRVNGLFALQKSGKDFMGCREIAVFVMANALKQLNASDREIREKLFKLNSNFYSPLHNSEINAVIKNEKIYKFTNKKVSEMLNLTEEEKGILFSKKRPGDRKERTKNNKINIAKLVIKGFSISEISKKLNLSISIVKHMRVAIKSSGGFYFWAAECNLAKYKKLISDFIKNLKNLNKQNFYNYTSGSFCNVSNILNKIYNIFFSEINLKTYMKNQTEFVQKKSNTDAPRGLSAC